MQIKEGLGWKAGYNDAKNVYGAEVVFQGSWDLYEISAVSRRSRWSPLLMMTISTFSLILPAREAISAISIKQVPFLRILQYELF